MDLKEFKKWFEEAEATFKAIDSDIRDKNFNWACFKAQQSGEFAFKAILWGSGKPAFGHSLISLAEELKSLGLKVPSKIGERCARLDKYYVPTRYANQWTERAPHTFFTRAEAIEAKSSVGEILKFVRKCWKLLEKGKKKERS